VGIRANEKKIRGCKHVSVDSAPDLELKISALSLREGIPSSYQKSNQYSMNLFGEVGSRGRKARNGFQWSSGSTRPLRS
jgi:hypothetical protein